ncbi:MAG: decarboxylating 6-phosphogluconate dehydrogenase [Armatimonadetes bacterium]|nr:decarboxylating 6-phosphogluconate dehydrogenase [Armatimonadota bacterium]
MDLLMIGLGKMGANMALRLVNAGHKVIGHSRTDTTIAAARERGLEATTDLAEAVGVLPVPRIVWLMVPAGDPVDKTIEALRPMLSEGDIIVDGGNSWYRDTVRRAKQLGREGLRFVDCGTSGGVWGLTEGYSLMVGGDEETVEYLRPLFEALAPAPDRGWGRMGPTGAGHFVKMVHNGIEYGMMQAYAEGFAILKRKEEFDLNLHRISEVWRYGSVIRSWLLDLIESALAEDTELADIAPFVPDSGEGRWTVQEAVDLDQPAPIITLALIQRLRSRDEQSYADRLLAVMRNQFGGHAVKHEDEADGN